MELNPFQRIVLLALAHILELATSLVSPTWATTTSPVVATLRRASVAGRLPDSLPQALPVYDPRLMDRPEVQKAAELARALRHHVATHNLWGTICGIEIRRDA